ncbi:hypothetical protein ACHAQA_005912 [Verticillium albo-atrum]
MAGGMAAPAKPGRNGLRPVKEVTEATRERETFKYDPSLYASVRFNDTGVAIPSAEIVSSGDSVLTGLAQLGAYQTGAERSFISLFDTTHQYVITEAMPTMALTPFLPSAQCPEPLALCGVAIPRNQGTCEHVLYLTNPALPKDDTELPLSLVPNLAADERFNTRPYCQFGEAGQFYAAVPIRTHRGINIGSYCIMSTKMPKGWTDDSPNRLRDVSRAIMGHLEATRSQYVTSRNELLSRGLRSFVEGGSTLTRNHGTGDTTSSSETGPARAPELESVLVGNQTQPAPPIPAIDQLREIVQGNEPVLSPEAISETPDQATGETSSGVSQQVAFATQAHPRRRQPRKPTVKTSRTMSDEGQAPPKGRGRTGHVFSRVASIMREAFDVEGCLFLDVSLGSYGSYRRPSVQSPSSDKPPSHDPLSTSGSDGPLTSEEAYEDREAMCEILGFSNSQSSSIIPGAQLGDGDGDDDSNSYVGMVPKRTMAKLLRRYPDGRIFNFDAVGELQSSDSSEDDNDPTAAGDGPDSEDRARRRKMREAAIIQRAFPEARSVAFIPVWNAKRERWFSGGFVYTRVPTRVLTLEGDMSFFKAFTNLAAAEVLNLEVRQADQAKSDALGSLSHELRTPLHGILLGTELLNDTDLDVFQGNLTHTIETCCSTLLDTIDHLLDYSKVNDLAMKRKQGTSASPGSLKRSARSDQFGKKQLCSEVQLDAIVEDVADSMYAGHSFRHFAHLSKADNLATSGIQFARDIFQKQGARMDVQWHNKGPSPGPRSDVAVHLSIDPTCSWLFRLEAGAVRRIVMNLLGNALKYTAAGTIWVSLTQEEPTNANMRRKNERIVKLVVRDTGKGISSDFLEHDLWKPFSQEDELAPGTGLGLSLVKTIISGLGGRIAVESQIGVGSTFTVTLPLEQCSGPGSSSQIVTRDNELFEQRVRDLKGLRVRLCGFDASGIGLTACSILESTCRNWLQLDVSSTEDTHKGMSADLMVWPDDGLPESAEELAQLAQTPHIIICRNSLIAYQRSTQYASAGYQGVFEFISQPIGPRKLARSMQLAYERWSGLPQVVATPRPLPQSQGSNSHPGNPTTPGVARPGVPPSPLRTFDGLSLGPISSHGSNANLEPVTSYFPPVPLPEETDLTPKPQDVPVKADTHLLVDDNHINLKVLSAYMSKLQLPYVAAVNGQEAVDAYLENPARFAAIFMDLSMPVMDGLEATQHIRAHEVQNRLRPVTIVALTGLASERTQREAFESGVDVFLTKPVRLETLRQQLSSIPTQNGAVDGV